MCYEHHNNVFLLRFCTVLSKYEPECLRFINNYNSTTSLYDRFNNKLLVTFRNENMVSLGQGELSFLPYFIDFYVHSIRKIMKNEIVIVY